MVAFARGATRPEFYDDESQATAVNEAADAAALAVDDAERRARADQQLVSFKRESRRARALERAGVRAPAGFAYQGHSIRSMAASYMAALGVPEHMYVWVCGWMRGSTTAVKHYVDPTVLPTDAARALWGWALLRQFEADAGVVVHGQPLPDPRDMQPAP